MTTEIVTLPPPTVTPMTLLQTAIANNMDPDKLGKLIELSEKWTRDRAIESWAAAMCKCQEEMPAVVKNQTNKQTQSRYADLDEVQRVVVPCYTRHGFSLCFGEEDHPRDGWTRIVCDVTHRDGHTKRYTKNMPPNGEGIKGNRMMTETHAAGSTSSYGRRYLTYEIFNLRVAGQADSDGNAPESAGWLTDEEMDTLGELLLERLDVTGKKVNEERFAGIFGANRFRDIPRSRFKDACAQLRHDIEAARKAKVSK